MVKLKTSEEIKIMEEGGRKLQLVVEELRDCLHEGITTEEIDNEAERLIQKFGGESSFKKVKNYYWSTCLPINEQVVHTPPSDRKLKIGDVLTVDIGMFYKGFHTDYADTVTIGKTEQSVSSFLDVGRSTLKKAIEAVKIGKKIGNISEVIEDEIYQNGYKILKDLTGHGIGRELHEDPFIFGYRYKPTAKTHPIKPGLTIAIEIIYSISCENIAYEEGSDWSIITADKSLSACFEHTIAVTDEEVKVLT